MRRLTVSMNVLAADLYWIRAIQYYGDIKLKQGDAVLAWSHTGQGGRQPEILDQVLDGR